MRKHQSLLRGAAVLVGATALTKIIGAVFKIPLANLVGGDGMGYFSTAYDLYLPIYALSMAGLPIALSKLVADAAEERRYRDVRQLLRLSQRAFLLTGLAGFILLLALAYPYTVLTHNAGALFSILVIAPSLLCCCLMSSYRGYYEGLRNMTPTAVSELIETAGKLAFGLLLAYAVTRAGLSEFARTGEVFGAGVTPAAGQTALQAAQAMLAPYAAAGAVAGVTLGTGVGLVFLALRHVLKGDGFAPQELLDARPARPPGETIRAIVSIAVPVVIGSLAVNVASLVDVVTVQRRLLTLVQKQPAAVAELFRGRLPDGMALSALPNYLYGCYKGFAFSVYNIIPTLTSVLGVSALPTIATAWVRRGRQEMRSHVESVLRVTAFIALPGGLGIAAVAGPITALLFPSKPLEASLSAPILAILGGAAVFAGLGMPMTNMLQAIGRQRAPVVNLLLALAVKFALNYWLVGEARLNVLGAPLATLACYAVLFAANLIALCRYAGFIPKLWRCLGKPAVAAALCAAAARVASDVLARYAAGVSAAARAGASIAAGALVFVFALLLLRGVTAEDVGALPGGEKIRCGLAKMKLLG